MSDIHGNLDKFKKMLEKISFNDNDVLYVLGDVIDRGESSIELLLYIKEQKNMKLLLGNHEDLMLQALNGDTDSMQLWFNIGGLKTYNQFNRLSAELQNDVLNYLKTLELFHIEENFLLTHSGLNIPKYMKNESLDKIIEFQDKQDFLWNRENFYLSKGLDGYTIIFGHTPTYNIDYNNVHKNRMVIWHDNIFADKICIDCGEGYNGGQLGCLCLDDMSEFYI